MKSRTKDDDENEDDWRGKEKGQLALAF